MTKYSNPCVRCGTERVVSKTWEEHVGYTTVVTKEMVCPNAECQKQVSMDNKRQQDRYASLKLKSAQRQMARKVALDAERAVSAK